ncbi:SusD/RagB family nutrient-binding outer membrane lipoprotein [Pedobacter nyackensis]|uniref:SusD/RagB family nutrient-binding outer membrane lipoprotein n=1 Tax=Pedobacter nyackensis TaxID=475255 RepID=UPI002931B1DC|nr:SusD/RagB family nutrient-binding outer membrane lipoprotein [Pedobacter nyackensis]
MKSTYFKPIVRRSVIMVAIICSVFTSCKKTLEGDYANPDGFTTPTPEGFYSNVQQQLGIFRTSYGEYFHNFEAFNRTLGTGGVVNDGAANTFGWGHAPYGDIYAKLRSIRAMSDALAKLPADQQKEYEVFVWTGMVIKDYLFYQLTDAYNDVPYTDAMKAQDNNFFPKFDKQQFIYTSILGELKDVSGKLKNYQIGGSAIQQLFLKNDIWFAGDLVKWRTFINSLRLRLAMRISVADATLAKTTIQEVLQDGVYAKDRTGSITLVDKQQDKAFEFLINRSFEELRTRASGYLWLPQNMMKVLRKAGQPDDPRIQVLFQPDKDGNYTPMPAEANDISPIRGMITQTDLTKTFPSLYNRSTFERNVAIPSLILTSSEVHLILAEAGLRWPDLGIIVTNELKAGIQESIDIYYEINAGNTNKSYVGFIPESMPVKPDQTTIDLFLAAKITEFNAANNTEKLGLIYDQKYVHFNILKPYELWADTRRLTKELGARVKKGASNYLVMERTVYPSTEESNNRENFLAVKASNNYTTPVWWTGR